MADPTIKDVLKALEAMRREMATKADLRAEVESLATKADVDGLRKEMHKRFDDVDEELDKHASVTHRKLEADIASLKKRPAAPAARAPRRR